MAILVAPANVVAMTALEYTIQQGAMETRGNIVENQAISDPIVLTVGTDLSVVIKSACLGLSAVEPHALYFLCTCQLDLARVSEFGSRERFTAPDTVQQVMSLGTSLI